MKTILIVDDDLLILQILSGILDTEYQVLTSTSGEQALRLAQKNAKLSLAIYDVDMPGMNGIETAKIIWEKYHIPFIIVSQFNDNETIERAIASGALAYLIKPIIPKDVLPAVRAALRRGSEIINQNDRAIELTQTINQNRKLLSSIIHTEEERRKVLVNELHDEVGQQISLIGMSITRIGQISKDIEVQQLCSTVSSQVAELYRSIRAIMLGLRPEILDVLVVGGALEHLLIEWGNLHPLIKLESEQVDKTIKLPSPLDIILYRALQELLTNISKYANASKVAVLFKETKQGVLLSVSDNGMGFDTKNTPFGIGLSSIREKVLSIGGEFIMESAQDKGTKVVLNLPINSDEWLNKY